MKRHTFIGGLSAAVVSFALVALPALAVGTNGSFETGIDPGSFTTLNAGDNTSMTDWSVDAGSVDYIGTYWTASDGVRSVDLNGLAPASIHQTIPTVVGATYDVSFDLSGNPDSLQPEDSLWSPSLKDVKVSATGAAAQDFTYDTAVELNDKTNMKWAPHTYSFVATAASTDLTFASQIPGAFGPVIDHMVLTETLPAPVAACPENTTETFVETVPVDSANPAGATTGASLASGQTYKIVASGTWQNRGFETVDAKFTTPDSWVTVLDAPIGGYPADLLELQINSTVTPWGAYLGTHSYTTLVTGAGAPANFRVYDGTGNQQDPSWFGDNVGSLSVSVYACAPIVVPPTTGTISGQKYNDLNRNGKKDEGEPGLQGWVIRLLLDGPNETHTLVGTATTDANGNYTFANVAPGTYDVRETHQKGWKRMSKNPGDIVLEAGDAVTGVDFGNAQKKKTEKEDNDNDDNHNDHQGVFCAHGHSDYGKDKDKKEHQYVGARNGGKNK